MNALGAPCLNCKGDDRQTRNEWMKNGGHSISVKFGLISKAVEAGQTVIVKERPHSAGVDPGNSKICFQFYASIPSFRLYNDPVFKWNVTIRPY